MVGPFSKVGQIKVPKWTKSEYRNQQHGNRPGEEHLLLQNASPAIPDRV
jgi:hypothetical protein